MKKIFTIVLVFASIISFAQVRPSAQYGLKLGISNSITAIIDNRTDIFNKFRNDINAGVYYRRNYNKFSLQPELYFQAKGGSFRAGSNFAETNNSVLRNNYQYITGSLILGYEVAKNIHLVAGPEYGYAINAGTKRGPYAKTDFSLAGGVRIDMLDMAHLFSLNIRYIHGLTNTTNKTYTLADKSMIPLTFQNRTLQVAASFSFGEYYRWSKFYKKKK